MHELSGNDIYLSYGNGVPITIPIMQSDGKTPYVIQEGDVVKVTVRVKPFTGIGPAPKVVMHGKVDIEEGVPVWTISADDSRLPCKTYYWDAKITQADGTPCTYANGKFIVLPVETTK